MSNKKVILSIFAGRERYMRILKLYLDRLLERKLIHKVHLWDFTRNSSDKTYIRDLCQNTNYLYFDPEPTHSKDWIPYYRYYMHNITDDAILIKCDDDILYIDIENFSLFIAGVIEDVVYFPIIVNNDVCSFIYSSIFKIDNIYDWYNKADIHNFLNRIGDREPLTTWENGLFRNYPKARQIHELFLSDPSKYHLRNKPLVKYGSRVSINFFAMNARTVRDYFYEFLHKGDGDDETFMSSGICRIKGTRNIINLNMCVVHFQFENQEGARLDQEFLERYHELALTQK
jgi:hypothetical protein